MRALAAHISLAAVAFAAATDGVASRQWSTYAPLGTLVAHGAASPVPAHFELDGAGLAANAAEYAASAHHRRVQRALLRFLYAIAMRWTSSDGISAMPPPLYADRFRTFMAHEVRPA